MSRPAVIIGAPPQIVGASAQPPAAPSAAGGRRPGTAQPHGHEAPAQPSADIFGQDLISEKSLDEVILAYLSEDSKEE